ncbi:uncharacterized protein LOC134744937 [Cydia strobilella]|uniref:uncharacterized protein LOC134744937 n=1 Tax=Cydia strobilella TaxID=1100964 RepID=UPI003007C25A
MYGLPYIPRLFSFRTDYYGVVGTWVEIEGVRQESEISEQEQEYIEWCLFVNNLKKTVEGKVSDGDLKGAARLLFSTDVLSVDSTETLSALQDKHPSAPATPYFLDPPTEPYVCLQVQDKDTKNAILSFKTGSAAGLDGLSPQHLKDLTSHCVGDTGKRLIIALTKLVNLMLSGKVNPLFEPIIYGANLIALTKKDGGIRPIAVGSTFRRLTSKISVRHVLSKLQKQFEPVQLGFGTKGGCEAAVHALRTCLINDQCEVLLKIDVKNAFNSLNRDALLAEVNNHAPELYNYLLNCYANPSKLLYKNHEISSEVGCQQGDPLGPAIFSLAINPVVQNLNSKFNVWYLDDGTLGGDVNTVLADLSEIINKFKLIGLELNCEKCELYLNRYNPDIVQKFQAITPNIKVVSKDSLNLLGSPIFEEAIPSITTNAITKFKNCADRLLEIDSHSALTILKFCLFVPKFTYLLRCCPFWKHQNSLLSIDNLIRSSLESVLNIQLSEHSWNQASLPIRFGGLALTALRAHGFSQLQNKNPASGCMPIPPPPLVHI